LLGLSHTAVRKWIQSGDIPVVLSSHGRREIPVSAVVDLYESVRDERESGRRRRHTLEPAMIAGRQLARALDPKKLVDEDVGKSDPHRRAQLRKRAYHRALGRRLRRSTVDDARHVLWEWRQRGVIDPRYADQWESILERPLPEIRDFIGSDEPIADDLRQNSPFAGLLSEPERRRIFEEIR
jgi:hypothetical protein